MLVCPSDRILRPLEITGVAGYLNIVGSREEALGAIAAGVAASRRRPGFALQNSSKRSAGLSAGGGVSFSGLSWG